jgi:hypothetical protein
MRNWPRAVLACTCSIGLFGISRPEAEVTPSAASATELAVSTGDNAISGIALVPSADRLFAIHFSFYPSAANGSADEDASVDVYDTRSLSIVGRVPVCHGPNKIAANDATQRVVVVCNTYANIAQHISPPATVVIVDAASLNVVASQQLSGPIDLAMGGKRSPYAYALTQNHVTRIDTGTGSMDEQLVGQVDPGVDHRALSVSSEPPDRVTLYSDRSATTLQFDGWALPVVRDFGRERYPAASVSIDGSDDFALGAAGALVTFDSNGHAKRTPICNAPVELFWSAVVRRLITVCSPLEPADRIDVISSDEAGSDARKLPLDDGALIHIPPVSEALAAAQDPVSGRFVVAGSQSVHVLDPAGPAQLYEVAHPGFATGLALDEASGDAFVGFSNNGSGGGVMRFNIRGEKPVQKERTGQSSAGGAAAIFVLQPDFAALPARVDPPGVRSHAACGTARRHVHRSRIALAGHRTPHVRALHERTAADETRPHRNALGTGRESLVRRASRRRAFHICAPRTRRPDHGVSDRLAEIAARPRRKFGWPLLARCHHRS